MKVSVESVVATFGQAVKAKLANPSTQGEPEEQLRGPFEELLSQLAALLGFPVSTVVAVGETSLSSLRTRPDYSVTVRSQLVGFIELKAPGKGADPRRFKGRDREQWEKLQSLPNLIYSDGNEFSLWQNGEQVDTTIRLEGDIAASGRNLRAPTGFLGLFERFLRWHPIPPTNAKELARTTALLCRLLREEVTEQLDAGSEALTEVANDWRKILFPDATNEMFADGYAQAVTFGLLMARAKKIVLATGLGNVSRDLAQSNSLIGTALKVLTESAENQSVLKTSLGTLIRVLDEVDWSAISKGNPEAWLYFYEDFLEIYDRKLRRQTGSYYTPPEVVEAMVRLVDDVLKSSRFGLHTGLASSKVTLVDPATGTGTFILGVLRRITETIKSDEGEGAVRAALDDALRRVIAFEMQLGPFAVAQVRIIAEIVELTGVLPVAVPRMFVTNTLGDPYDDESWIPNILAPIGKSRKEANRIKRDESITVVIGNPPYKEKAKGLGGWIEGEGTSGTAFPLEKWIPPNEWGLSTHVKHLRNLYIYFWRWATWKVFDSHPAEKNGIVCFITVAGFLSGPGFEKMRDYLRRTCDDIWVIDCTPEGHQPDVPTRIFQGVQQPVCIVLAARTKEAREEVPAKVRFKALPSGSRLVKFQELTKISMDDPDWIRCPDTWRAPFLPLAAGAWLSFPALEELFTYNGSGVMPGRTWIIAPDKDSLKRRWRKLVSAPEAEKELLFHPHEVDGRPGDRHSKRVMKEGLPGFPATHRSIAEEQGVCPEPIQYAFRSLDRQWIIPDNRLINRPNPDLWRFHSESQIYLTAFSRVSPSAGPALTITGLIPDLDHYKGSFGGRVFPLWRSDPRTANIRPRFLEYLSGKFGFEVGAEDVLAYVAAIAAHPGFTNRFRQELASPGLRIPISAQGDLFTKVSEVGRQIVWLHTFGERMMDPERGRPAQPPRLPEGRKPFVSAEGTIPQESTEMPDAISFDEENCRLEVGFGFVSNVTRAMWDYEISGKRVLLHWFSYRKANRQRPIMGDRRQPSALSSIQPDHWLPEYTTELLNVLNVLGLLIDQEPIQARLLEEVCSGPTFSVEELRRAGAFEIPNNFHVSGPLLASADA